MQVEHKTEKGILCFQKVKDNHTHFELAKLADYDPDDYLYLIADESFTKLPPGKWQLIGLTSEVTEEWLKEVCFGNTDYIEDGLGPTDPFVYKLDSFKSLMQNLQVYEVNPYKAECHCSIDSTLDEMEACGLENQNYYEVQQKVGKWIVLFKPNEK